MNTTETYFKAQFQGLLFMLQYTDHYKLTMAKCGFPLREETFYLHCRKGEGLVNPLDLTQYVGLLLQRLRGDFRGSRVWTDGMEEAIYQDVKIEYAVPEGGIIRPRAPILTLTGPSFLLSWMEPALINLHFAFQARAYWDKCNQDWAKATEHMFPSECRMFAACIGVTNPPNPLVPDSRLEAIRQATRDTLVQASKGSKVFEVGLRGCTGFEHHKAVLKIFEEQGGNATSSRYGENVFLQMVGTTGHEHQQRWDVSIPNEHNSDLAGFRAVLEQLAYPTYLIDTFDADLGLETAVTLVRGFSKRKHAIRFDSGNLLAQTDRCLQLFGGVIPDNVTLIYMDGLNPTKIREIQEHAIQLGVDPKCLSFGVGSYITEAGSPITRSGISLVYKLSMSSGVRTHKECGTKSSLGGIPVWDEVKGETVDASVAG